MKLKKIVFFEVLSFVALLLVVMVTLELIPFLQPSKQNTSIGLYSSISYPENTVTLTSDDLKIARFNYSSYDPAIIVLKLSFKTCEEQGYLLVYCNYRIVASIFVEPETPPVVLNLISVSGLDWVEPFAIFGMNELLFETAQKNGYAGTLCYQITLRGSR